MVLKLTHENMSFKDTNYLTKKEANKTGPNRLFILEWLAFVWKSRQSNTIFINS